MLRNRIQGLPTVTKTEQRVNERDRRRQEMAQRMSRDTQRIALAQAFAQKETARVVRGR